MSGIIDRVDPFTCDGVQAVVGYAEGFTSPYATPTVFNTAREAERWVRDFVDEMTRYTDNITFTYYGYDPNVYGDSGHSLGTDGYPDFIGQYDPSTERVEWQPA